MNRFDRILGILLHLRSGKSIPASDLARRFEVSLRTIYRDMDALSALGVPVYAELGREGGYRLLEGYFLPPLMFSTGEAISLLLGLTMLHSLSARPFDAESETAEKKLLAAVPDRLRLTLAAAQQIVGFENAPEDAFHREWSVPPSSVTVESDHGRTVEIFLQAILDHKTVHLRYYSPYRRRTDAFTAEPLGVFWDRDLWYLAGRRRDRSRDRRLWRADRVLAIELRDQTAALSPDFNVRDLLDRSWLGEAMAQWIREAPVRIRLTQEQVNRLKRDWYYRHAYFEPQSDGRIIMTFGQDVREVVMELMRWLGPGAELIEPAAWRDRLREDLKDMLTTYAATNAA